MSPRPTHFLCLPLITPASLPQFTASLASFSQDKVFQNNVTPGRPLGRPSQGGSKGRISGSDTEDQSDGGSAIRSMKEEYIPTQAIRPVGTLHLTLGVMYLNNKDRLDAATSFLRNMDLGSILARNESGNTIELPLDDEADADVSKKVRVNPSGILVQVHGLHAMQRPHQTRVLYAQPLDTSKRLSSFCKDIRASFVDAGFLIDEDRELVLHATIVNTIYASKGPRRSKNRRLEVNATDLIDRWKDKVWAEVEIRKLSICEMGAKEDDDGVVRYTEVASVDS